MTDNTNPQDRVSAKQARIVARAEVDAARAELVDYLEEFEEAINFPKKIARGSRHLNRRARRFANEQPLVAAGVAVAAVAVVAGVVAIIVKSRGRD